MNLLLLCLLLPFTLPAWSQVKAEFSGNLEAQSRHSWNGQQAKDLSLLENGIPAQDWDQSEFDLIYGNLSGKLEFKDSRLESNFFARYTNSNLYRNDSYISPLIFNFPNKLVAREMFNLQNDQQGDRSRTEYVLNKFFYEWDYAEHRFMAGRIYVNYGVGEIFNPINPFNQPTGLTAISQVAQGNDGLNFTFYKNDKHTINFYFLGDKSLQGYKGQIDKTLWAHGEYQWSNELQLDYVIGEDQKRHKAGGQVRYNLSQAMIFMQTLYQTRFTDDLDGNQSHHLWDVMMGVDQQMTNKWHVRVEGGHQKRNKFATSYFNDRFLPSEYFIALANQYEIHPLVKLGGTIINDIKTGFTYFITRNTYSFGESSEAELFAYVPMAKGSGIENQAQKLVTTDVGLAIRTFF
jgi:hypothetical protein